MRFGGYRSATAKKKAIMVVAHAILVIIWHVLATGRPYDELGAETLARMPLADPRGLQRLELPGPDAAALDRRVRACERLTGAASEHKVRIKDLVRQLMPMTPLTGDLGKADLAVLERYADPRSLLGPVKPS